MNNLIESFKERLEDITSLTDKTRKCSVLVVQQFPSETNELVKLPHVRECISHVMAFIELGSVNVLEAFFPFLKNKFDYIIFDNDIKIKNSKSLIDFATKNFEQEKLFFYSDLNTWAESSLSFLNQISNGIHNKHILVKGKGALHEIISNRLRFYNFLNGSDCGIFDIIIGTSIREISFDLKEINCISNNTKCYDIGISNFSEEFIIEAKKIGAEFYRIDIRAGLSSTILNILETNYLIQNVLGETVINGIHLVAGGLLGDDGSIVLDDINKPRKIIGVSNGKGSFKTHLNKEDKRNYNYITEMLNTNAKFY